MHLFPPMKDQDFCLQIFTNKTRVLPVTVTCIIGGKGRKGTCPFLNVQILVVDSDCWSDSVSLNTDKYNVEMPLSWQLLPPSYPSFSSCTSKLCCSHMYDPSLYTSWETSSPLWGSRSLQEPSFYLWSSKKKCTHQSHLTTSRFNQRCRYGGRGGESRPLFH